MLPFKTYMKLNILQLIKNVLSVSLNKTFVSWYEVGRKEMFYLMTHSTHFILRLYGIGPMVKDQSDSEWGTCCHHMGYSFQLTARVLLLIRSVHNWSRVPSYYFHSVGNPPVRIQVVFCDGELDSLPLLLVHPFPHLLLVPIHLVLICNLNK